MPFTIDSARNIFSSNTLSADAVPALTARFNQLSAEDQLAWIWFAYLEMGKTITVAAPGAANMQFAEPTIDTIKAMGFQEQSQVMCDLANRTDTPISRTYATWTPNIKLGLWYRLGELMEQGVVAPIPEGYKLSANANAVLVSLQGLDSGQQITVLRNTVVDMGFDTGKMGNFQSVSEPVAPPTEISKRTKVNIESVTNTPVLNYMN